MLNGVRRRGVFPWHNQQRYQAATPHGLLRVETYAQQSNQPITRTPGCCSMFFFSESVWEGGDLALAAGEGRVRGIGKHICCS